MAAAGQAAAEPNGGGPGSGAKRYPDHTVSGQNGIREETERPTYDERSVDINMLSHSQSRHIPIIPPRTGSPFFAV